MNFFEDGLIDMQYCQLFPYLEDIDEIGTVLQWMVGGKGVGDDGRNICAPAKTLFS